MLLLLCSNKGTRCTRAIVSIIDANVLRTTIEFFFTLTLSLPFTAFFVWAAFQGQCLDGFSHKRRFPSTLHWHPQVAKFYFLANSFDGFSIRASNCNCNPQMALSSTGFSNWKWRFQIDLHSRSALSPISFLFFRYPSPVFLIFLFFHPVPLPPS